MSDRLPFVAPRPSTFLTPSLVRAVRGEADFRRALAYVSMLAAIAAQEDRMPVVRTPHSPHTSLDQPVKPYHRTVAQLAAKYLPPEGSFLDIGCGAGHVCRLVRDTRPTAEIFAADAFPACLASASAKVDLAGSYLLDEKTFPLLSVIERRFDVIAVSHVLEHLHNPVDGLRQVMQLLRPKGVAVLAVPNPARPNVLFGNLFGLVGCNVRHVVAWDPGHWRNFLVNIMGLRIIESGTDYVFIPGCNSYPWLERAGVWLAKAAPLWCFSNISVVRRRPAPKPAPRVSTAS
jgi:2-polyprenyl-3-methyl-5-hydroxy-6-metoxy-1,4-benzoquinol methylase